MFRYELLSDLYFRKAVRAPLQGILRVTWLRSASAGEMDPELFELLEKLKASRTGDKAKFVVNSPFVKRHEESIAPSVDEKQWTKKNPSLVDGGGWLYKYPSEGSKESAASAAARYPRKCRACNWWLSDKEQYEKHLNVEHPRGLFNENTEHVPDRQEQEANSEQSTAQLGVPRRFWFSLDRANNQIVWRVNENIESRIIGQLKLDTVKSISVGIAMPGVKEANEELINDYFTLQAKGRYVVVRAKNAPEASSWVRDLRVAVFELGQPPPGEDGIQQMFDLLRSCKTEGENETKNEESVVAMAIERLICNDNSLLNAVHDDGDTVLITAVRMGLIHVTRVLLSLGANLLLVGRNCESALHVAARMGSVEIVDALLKITPSIEKLLNAKSTGGQSCVHDAVTSGSLMCLEMLVAAGADPYLRDDYERTLLHVAASKTLENKEMVAMLCEFIEDALDWKDFEGNTALHIAARLGSLDTAEQLLQTAADTSLKNKAGATAHAIAMAGNHRRVAELIGEYMIEEEEYIGNGESFSGEQEKGPHVPQASLERNVLDTYTYAPFHFAEGEIRDTTNQPPGYSRSPTATSTIDQHSVRPTEYSPVHHPEQPGAGWVESFAQDGRRYFYNSFSGHSQWEKPPDRRGGLVNEGELSGYTLHMHQQQEQLHALRATIVQDDNHRLIYQQSNGLSNPSPPAAINTSPPHVLGFDRRDGGQAPEFSPFHSQHVPSQTVSPNQNRSSTAHGSPGSTASSQNSPFGMSPHGSPHVSPHGTHQFQFCSRHHDQRIVEENFGPSVSPGSYQGQYSRAINSGSRLRQSRTSPNADVAKQRRPVQVAIDSLAHPISPMNVDNPALNKRLIEERRKARAARRMKKKQRAKKTSYQ